MFGARLTTIVGSAMAVGISCANTGMQSALDLLEPLQADSVDFVRQGALIATALVLMQQPEPKVGPMPQTCLNFTWTHLHGRLTCHQALWPCLCPNIRHLTLGGHSSSIYDLLRGLSLRSPVMTHVNNLALVKGIAPSRRGSPGEDTSNAGVSLSQEAGEGGD